MESVGYVDSFFLPTDTRFWSGKSRSRSAASLALPSPADFVTSAMTIYEVRKAKFSGLLDFFALYYIRMNKQDAEIASEMQ